MQYSHAGSTGVTSLLFLTYHLNSVVAYPILCHFSHSWLLQMHQLRDMVVVQEKTPPNKLLQMPTIITHKELL